MTALHQAKAVEALTDDEIDAVQADCDCFLCDSCDIRVHEFARAVESFVLARAALQQQPEPVAKPSRVGEDGWRKLAESQAALLAVQAVPREPVACEHKGDHTPKWDHIVCDDCGAVLVSGADWGIAARKWFQSLEVAKFYRDHGRLPAIHPQPESGNGGLMVIADALQYVLDSQERTDGVLSDDFQSARVWPETPTRGVLKRWIETLRAASPSAPAREEAGLPAVDSQTNPPADGGGE